MEVRHHKVLMLHIRFLCDFAILMIVSIWFLGFFFILPLFTCILPLNCNKCGYKHALCLRGHVITYMITKFWSWLGCFLKFWIQRCTHDLLKINSTYYFRSEQYCAIFPKQEGHLKVQSHKGIHLSLVAAKESYEVC